MPIWPYVRGHSTIPNKLSILENIVIFYPHALKHAIQHLVRYGAGLKNRLAELYIQAGLCWQDFWVGRD